MTNLGRMIMEKKHYIGPKVEVVTVLFEGHLCANTNERGEYNIGGDTGGIHEGGPGVAGSKGNELNLDWDESLSMECDS